MERVLLRVAQLPLTPLDHANDKLTERRKPLVGRVGGSGIKIASVCVALPIGPHFLHYGIEAVTCIAAPKGVRYRAPGNAKVGQLKVVQMQQ